MITLRSFPGTSAEEVGVVVSGVVIAPVADVLDRSRAGNGGVEARGLRDEPVGHVSAVAVAADGEVVGIGCAVFHQSVDAFENIFAGTGDDLRNDLFKELVAVSRGAAVVGLEHQQSAGGR